MWERIPDPTSPDGLGTADPEEEGFNAWASPLHFVAALGTHLRDLVEAGRYFLDDPFSQTRSLMVDEGVVELHLTECQLFARKWMTCDPRPSNKDISIRLRDADLEIRSNWWSLFEVNSPEGIGFTSCILQSQSVAKKL